MVSGQPDDHDGTRQLCNLWGENPKVNSWEMTLKVDVMMFRQFR